MKLCYLTLEATIRNLQCRLRTSSSHFRVASAVFLDSGGSRHELYRPHTDIHFSRIFDAGFLVITTSHITIEQNVRLFCGWKIHCCPIPPESRWSSTGNAAESAIFFFWLSDLAFLILLVSFEMIASLDLLEDSWTLISIACTWMHGSVTHCWFLQ